MEILLVDDSDVYKKTVAFLLGIIGHSVTCAANGAEAAALLQTHGFELVMTETRMFEAAGFDLANLVKNTATGGVPDVVYLTNPTDNNAELKMQTDGLSYIVEKPMHITSLCQLVERIIEHRKAVSDTFPPAFLPRSEAQAAQYVPPSWQIMGEIIWRGKGQKSSRNHSVMSVSSSEMKDLLLQAEMLHRKREVSVLLEGETGTGKELFAKYIHFGSANQAARQPFVAVNCANLNQGLIESELFGYEPGAFTGALARGKQGKVALAKGGTLLLDEVNSLSLESQARLLRFIEDNYYYRVGGTELIEADVRIIGASNRNLLEMSKISNFRADLYYRLGTVRLVIPPLRERRNDILPLANLFYTQAIGNDKARIPLSPKAEMLLLDYRWPGNVRELKNVISYAAMLQSDGLIEEELLVPVLGSEAGGGTACAAESPGVPSAPNGPNLLADGFNLQEYLDQITIQIISDTLRVFRGNRSRTAEYLGLSRGALYRRMQELGC
ncbi:MAG: sigma 54-interacting transcriptional regulator [Solirubrobacterales bacterium]